MKAAQDTKSLSRKARGPRRPDADGKELGLNDCPARRFGVKSHPLLDNTIDGGINRMKITIMSSHYLSRSWSEAFLKTKMSKITCPPNDCRGKRKVRRHQSASLLHFRLEPSPYHLPLNCSAPVCPKTIIKVPFRIPRPSCGVSLFQAMQTTPRVYQW